MMRWLVTLVTLSMVLALVACAGPDNELGGSNNDDGTFALTNTTQYSPDGLLRGQGLKLYTELPADLQPNTIYQVDVTNDNTGALISQGDLATTEGSHIQPYALLFDVGQNGDVEEGDNVRVSLTHANGTEMNQIISLSVLRLPGWGVEEVEAPEVFVCDERGAQANAYTVFGPDPGEVSGEIRVTGRGFPAALRGAEVDVYIVEARDNWMDGLIPQTGEEGHVYGPVAVTVDSQGNLPVTATGFLPALDSHVGVYDLLVDTDRNQRMDWSIGVKDGGDGVDEQVGFTVQYSQAWLRARRERHILVNIAYNSGSRGGGAWSNNFRAGEQIFSYLNPPVMHEYHFAVTKWVVFHQDFEDFWNNPASETGPGGCIPFSEIAAQRLGVPVQRGCTNTGPVAWGAAAVMLDLDANPTDSYDVIFDRNGDGCYMPGEDLLDVVGGGITDGGIVSIEEYDALSDEDRVGFRVIP